MLFYFEEVLLTTATTKERYVAKVPKEYAATLNLLLLLLLP